MYTFTYSYAYTYAHAYAYTYPYSYTCAHVHVHVLSHTRVLSHARTVPSLSLPLARMHINVRACVKIYAYKCTCISIYTTEYVYTSSIHYYTWFYAHTHAHTLSHAQKHTYTLSHTYILQVLGVLALCFVSWFNEIASFELLRVPLLSFNYYISISPRSIAVST